MNRRNWISRVTMGSAGLTLVPHLGISMPAADNNRTYLRLGANENPYGCSSEVLKVFNTAQAEVNRYAFATIPEVKTTLADAFGYETNHVLIGPGSSGLLEAVVHFMLEGKGEITTATPTFDILPAMFARFNGNTNYIPLKKDHSLDLKGMLQKTQERPGLVYIVNPNNPIGHALNPQELRTFIKEVTPYSYVLIDEAYLEFSDSRESMIAMVKHPKVMVIKTFSKVYGLAGLRIGYGFAHPEWASALEKHMIFSGLPVSSPALTAVKIALEDQAFVDFVVQKNKESRALLVDTLEGLGISFIPSQTSFMLFDISKYRGDFGADMKDKGIIIGIRDYLDKKWCRVSMGTVEETTTFCQVLHQLWNA
ncbi:pyridoxal phosphate-dependent aminotransferase [Pareuzebyella sediminis]|uniref:pyridoxal phosphate-dependent aminotransferase n=1 Tax=Pareuzebyella sediminis TaxID=2607998 RepID=UPI0011EF645F|nr:histidinol-phosphate transaminase [Pareuzebyella sediminis]